MLHVIVTMVFLGAGMFSLALVAAMLVDHADAIGRALGLGKSRYAPLRLAPSRVRIVASPRFAPMAPVPLRAAA